MRISRDQKDEKTVLQIVKMPGNMPGISKSWGNTKTFTGADFFVILCLPDDSSEYCTLKEVET